MTKKDFNFICPPALFERIINPDELINTLKSMITSGYNVGEALEFRLNEVTGEDQLNFSEEMMKDLAPLLTCSEVNDYIGEKSIYDLLIALKSISSSKTKEEYLINWFTSISEQIQEEFLTFVNLTFSSLYTYNCTVKAISDISLDSYPVTKVLPLSTALNKLHLIGLDEETKPKEKVEQIREIYSNVNPKAKKIIFFIIDRAMDIKMNEKSFYNILGFTGRVNIIPYQRCEGEDKSYRLTFPCMVQLKADGKFQNIIFSPTKKQGLTLNRSGKTSKLKPFTLINQFNEETGYLTKIWNIDFVLMGEALIKVPGEHIVGKSALDIKVYSRQKGNGLLNSYGNRFQTFITMWNKVLEKLGTKKVIKPLEDLIAQVLEWKYVEENIVYQLWNMVPYINWKTLDTKFSCIKSFQYLNDFVINYNKWLLSKNLDTNIVVIHNEFHDSLDTITDLYQRVLSLDLEGLVVKNQESVIEHGTCTTGIIKMKDFKDCDLKVVGIEPGTGKYIGGIGSLICVTECTRMTVRVAGLTDRQRGFIRIDPNDSSKGLMLDPEHTNDKFDGLIITAKYNALSFDKAGVPSLSLPSMMEVRTDVARANFLHEIKK